MQVDETDYEYYCRQAAYWQRRSANIHAKFMEEYPRLRESLVPHKFLERQSNYQLRCRVYYGTAMDYLDWAIRSK